MTAKIKSIPPPNADLATTWAFLKEGLGDIMTKPQTGMPYHRYMALSTASYNYCTSPSPIPGRADIMGSDLYKNLIGFLATRLSTLKDASGPFRDEALLWYYAVEWDRYTKGANHINRLFAYLNRGWVKRERDEGRKSIYPVYTLCLVQWKINFFIPIQNSPKVLTRVILRFISRQRNGEEIDLGLVKKAVDSFVSLGLDEDDVNKVHFDVYRTHFEIPFLGATENYYKFKSRAFLARGRISDYLKKVEEWMEEEEGRVEKYFNTETKKPLISSCMHVLIREHLELMYEASQSLLDHDMDEDLRRMYGFLARNPNDLEPLRGKFEEHVKRAGLAAVSRLVGEANAVTEVDPKAYVDALFEVHRKCSGTIESNFERDAGFVARLDNACRDFVNKNAATGTTSTKPSELLAKYVDDLLTRWDEVAEEDLESALDRVVVLFKYLKDKDVFEIFYATRLSKRLIHSVSVPEEAEASMISKLREVCGLEYTKRLERMFTDVSLSRVLTDGFRERMAHDHGDMGINFNIMVLGANFWPLNAPTGGFNIPVDISPLHNRFSEYHQRKHSGRRLVWLWNHSKNELRTNYLNQKYILMTSSYQMAILLQYNNHDMLTLDKLATATAINKDVLMPVLASLVDAKVLVNEEKDRYDLNLSFKSKRIRNNLSLPITANGRTESTHISRTIDEDRKYQIQATICRIMKARRTMKSQALIQEVISLISQKFVPGIPDIKKAIETLVQKGHIERVEGTHNIFNFVP